MSKKTVTVDVGGFFIPLLTTLFIGLKLTGYINWSWWWVLSPVWIGGLVGLGILALFFIIIASLSSR